MTSACAAGQLAQTADEKASIDGINSSVGSIDLRAVSIQPPDVGTPAYVAGSAAKLQIVFVNNSNSPDTLTSITSSAVGGWSAFADYSDAYHVQQAALLPKTAGAVPPPTIGPSSPTAASGAASSTARGGGTGAATGSPGAPASRGSSSRRPVPLPSVSRTAPLPKGVQSVLLPANARLAFGTPEAKGAILLLPVTKPLRPGNAVQLTFTFERAGSVTVVVPVQLGTSVPSELGSAPATGG
ncbi:MAG: hypothetical protein M3Y06_03225 [Actinomycetota bacterium]|nr:hypothetical protein [Actinomycetota bacterium]